VFLLPAFAHVVVSRAVEDVLFTNRSMLSCVMFLAFVAILRSYTVIQKSQVALLVSYIALRACAFLASSLSLLSLLLSLSSLVAAFLTVVTIMNAGQRSKSQSSLENRIRYSGFANSVCDARGHFIMVHDFTEYDSDDATLETLEKGNLGHDDSSSKNERQASGTRQVCAFCCDGR